MGIAIQLGVQVALNILVVTDSIPNTGIALPFFSYGGTALLMILGEMGVVLSISRRAHQKRLIFSLLNRSLNEDFICYRRNSGPH